MDILVCRQGLFGGTDKLLGRLYEWLCGNNYSADSFCLTEEEAKPLKKQYDLIILPSSQLGDISVLTKKGINIKRMLVWIMGMGAFSDSYYTYPPNSIFDKLLCSMYRNESIETLKWLIRNKAIVFTDSVGIYNTIRTSNVSSSAELKENIVPIAIECLENNEWILNRLNKREDKIRISWVGRVAKDFKEIPILHLIDDIGKYVENGNATIVLTIVGDGDAIDSVKQRAARANFQIDFIDNIPYEKLNAYFVENVDLLVAMGTSALDGAKIGCPTVVITPVRKNDPERVEYRWIYDSVGFSLGEFPDIDIETGQPRDSFAQIMEEYQEETNISERCFSYAYEFDTNVVFNALMNRELPEQIDSEMSIHIDRFSKMKSRKAFVKQIIKSNR